MPAGSQWEKRIGTVRVNAPAGGTNRSSFISTCSFDSGFRRYCPFAARLKNRGDHRAGMSNLDRTLPPARLCLVTARCPSLARPAQSNKPMFGTTEFAVSPVDSSEHIDISAEETCPAESVPMSEPRADGDAVE